MIKDTSVMSQRQTVGKAHKICFVCGMRFTWSTLIHWGVITLRV